jgi:hypothetical protein
LFDFDRDGDLDAFFVDAGLLPGAAGEPPRSRLLRNDGARFVDWTEAAGITVRAYGVGGAAADVEGDGDLDLYVTAFGANQLFLNLGDGTFADGTAEADVGDARWSTSAAFADFDRDGDLDLYVVNYLEYDLATARPCRDESSGLDAYCHPATLPSDADVYYRSEGDGSFVDATAAARLAESTGKGFGLVATDLDGDAWPDLYVANDTTPNFFFRNRRDGTFDDASMLSGAALGDRAVAEAGMGVAIGDVDHNGWLDLLVTNYSLESNALYANIGNGFFVDRRHVTGLAEPSYEVLGWGAEFADFDRDADLDLLVANGHVLDNIERIHPGLEYAQRNQVFVNEGGGRFHECPACGLDVVRVSRGLAVGDLDGDADLDAVVVNRDDWAEVWENVTNEAGAWLAIDLHGRGPNSQALGARVEVVVDGGRQVAQALSASSFVSQSSSTLSFGLGDATAVEAVVVRWPDGAVQRLALPINRRLALVRR